MGTVKSSKVRVGMFIPGLIDGGAQKQFAYLANEFQQRTDIDVTVFVLHEGVHDRLLRADVEVVRVEARSNYDPQSIIRLARELRRRNIDILLSWQQGADVPSYFVRKISGGARWIMTERDSSYPSDVRFWARNIVGRRSDRILANSEKGRQYWLSRGATGKSHRVRNIVQASSCGTLDDSDGPTAGVYTGIFVGRLVEQKNVMAVAKALSLFVQRNSSTTATFVGQGTQEDEIRKILSDERVDDRVGLLGFRLDAPELISRSSFLISLSRHEGSPNVVLEALSAGVPVVLSAIDEHVEIVGPDYPYLVSDPEDSAEVVAAIEAILANPTEVEEALQAGLENVNRMTGRSVAQEYFEHFCEVLATKRRSLRSAQGRN